MSNVNNNTNLSFNALRDFGDQVKQARGSNNAGVDTVGTLKVGESGTLKLERPEPKKTNLLSKLFSKFSAGKGDSTNNSTVFNGTCSVVNTTLSKELDNFKEMLKTPSKYTELKTVKETIDCAIVGAKSFLDQNSSYSSREVVSLMATIKKYEGLVKDYEKLAIAKDKEESSQPSKPSSSVVAQAAASSTTSSISKIEKTEVTKVGLQLPPELQKYETIKNEKELQKQIDEEYPPPQKLFSLVNKLTLLQEKFDIDMDSHDVWPGEMDPEDQTKYDTVVKMLDYCRSKTDPKPPA